jgi:hypothetical protein
VTSVQAETGRPHSVKEVATLASNHLAGVFDRTLVWTHPETLRAPGMKRVDSTEPATTKSVQD